jgi:hypothetical protein
MFLWFADFLGKGPVSFFFLGGSAAAFFAASACAST